ncbi:uncharacterized protein BDV17DRAFT_272805 [Aspergillus undulatus]|uniref:uncharacterized protein n=1 Tax=Aspergillus undulatus TaxID=1810928 RepID=UPI003CCE1CE3
MLRDVLGLETTPQLRPAKVTGYECKLWGQYPALLDAVDLESVVEGFVHRVEAVEHAERLAEYETSSYRAEPCRIIFTDGNVPAERKGYTFKFVGNPNDLSEVAFDLQTWLKRMRGNVDIVDREDVK